MLTITGLVHRVAAVALVLLLALPLALVYGAACLIDAWYDRQWPRAHGAIPTRTVP